MEQPQKSMYIIQNIETKELELATNLIIVSKITNISRDKMYHSFSRKKETIFEYRQYKIHKKIPFSKKNEDTIKPIK